MNKIKSEDEIEIKPNYSFWRHPIRWLIDRKKRRLLQAILNMQWRNGLREEVEQMQDDWFVYGQAIMKDGKRVDPKNFIKINK